MQGIFKPLLRTLYGRFAERLNKGNSLLLLGPRQTGKTTLVHQAIENSATVMTFPLQHPGIRHELEIDPSRLIRQVEASPEPPLVFIDEAQKVPELFDAVQYLIDEGKARFVITGSSARKLRRRGANLLPGRVRSYRLDPLTWGEFGWLQSGEGLFGSRENINNTVYSLEHSMVYGALPAVALESDEDYTTIYLEEEIRAEALSRNVGAFGRFLELAARESGTNPNLSSISRDAGVSVPTVKEFYSILEDTLVAERVEPFIRNSRKRILSTPRYYLFDTGVRNALARFPISAELANADAGRLFEHVVILEIIRRIRQSGLDWKVYYWRTAAGAEVDCIIDTGSSLIPVEIKSGSSVSAGSLKGLVNFMDEYGVERGYVVFRGRLPEKITERITAIPWEML